MQRTTRLWLVLSLVLAACAGSQATPPTGGVADPALAAVAATPSCPLDPRVKRGKLPNGLTYYILPHAKPEKRAQLWLAVNAGSILEDDDQQGLAHFIEHMGFNGTKRFPKQDIVNFVERAGMRFGPHLNAYTSFDETVYMLQVPTDNAELVDKALQVLRDWAGDVSLDGGRGRQGAGRGARGVAAGARRRHAPVREAGPRHLEGLEIRHAPAHRQARHHQGGAARHAGPLLQGLVPPRPDGGHRGGRLRAGRDRKEDQPPSSGPCRPAASPRPRTLAEMPRHAETLVSVETDPEMPTTAVTILNKLPPRPKRSEADYRRMLAEQLYHIMLNGRLDEIRRKPDAPFVQAGSGTASMVRSADVFRLGAVAKEGQVDRATAALLEELLRVEKFGFARQTELERAKKRVLRGVRQAVIERDKRDAREFSSEIVRHFLEGETMPGSEAEQALTEKLLPTFTAAELSSLARAWVGGGSRVVAITGPDRMKKISADEVQAIVQAVDKQEITGLRRRPVVGAAAGRDAQGRARWSPPARSPRWG